MKSVNVLVTSAVGDECLKLISSVSPRIKLTDVSGLFRAELSGDLSLKAKLDAHLAEVEIIYGLRLPHNILVRAPNLKWMQVMSAGVERFLDIEMVESPVIMTNVSGIHAVPISEFVIGLMLMFVKQTPLCIHLKQEKKWERPVPAILHSKTVGVVGLGSIGREVARLAKAFNMRVLATRRSAKQVGRARYVDLMLPTNRIKHLLSESDFVVLAVPFTPETQNLIGEEELRTMKPSAYLINIARGGIVDEEALVHALEERWIAGAGLDVFSTEPLPHNSRLWELPNVIISPHISGGMENYAVRATELFAENLERYFAGKRLLNVVDKKRGY
jgi:phosphoglycerate dehydrogenase-like enzyme